jgi:methyltransferase (TIGR00027 family)
MRTGDDTWDISTSVGATALSVAAARALEAQKPDPVTVDPYAEVFCRAAGGKWADIVDGKADHQLLTEFGRHFQSYQGARTKYFDGFFSSAAAAGVRQMVILAAGLDARGYRLPWPDDTVIFELDQPKVLEFKRTVLAEHGNAPTAERREVAVDLRDDWQKALREQGFEPERPSAWLAEGLLVYLPADAQLQLFGGIDMLASPGSRAAIEHALPPDALDTVRARERAMGVTLQFFALIAGEQSDPVEWFAAHGWDVVATALPDYMRSLEQVRPAPDTWFGPMAELVDSIRLISARR